MLGWNSREGGIPNIPLNAVLKCAELEKPASGRWQIVALVTSPADTASRPD